VFKSLGCHHLAATEAHAASASLVWGKQTLERDTPAWPVELLSYSFDLDDDLAKLVTIQTVPGGLEVDVQYGRDYLLRRDRYVIHLRRPPSITRAELGIAIQATIPILPGLAWPCIRLTYRF
jgi:hypothetical protein